MTAPDKKESTASAKPDKASEAAPPPVIQRYLLPIILVAGLIAFFFFGGGTYLRFETLASEYDNLKNLVLDQFALACLIYGLSYMVAVAFSLPIALPLTIAGGAILGWIAAPLIVVSATLGACIVFIAARTILADLLKARAGGFLQKLEAGFLKDDFNYLLAMRLIPAAPFWVINIVPAFTHMKLSRYALATAIGILPGTSIYVWVARGFDHLLAAGQTPDLSLFASPQILGPLIGLGLLSLMPIIWRKLKQSGANDK